MTKIEDLDFEEISRFVEWRKAPKGEILTTISERTLIQTAGPFLYENENSLRDWLKHKTSDNLYYQVNVSGTLRRNKKDKLLKAAKADISEVVFLHADIDPDDEKDWFEERRRILADIENFPIPPSATIDSGNGYQVLWRLTVPIQLDGTKEMAEEVERFNRQLAFLLRGDKSAVDISRILRLPGTNNIPDKRKRERGRKATRAKIIELNDNAYDLEQFEKAPAKKSNSHNVSRTSEVLCVTEQVSSLDNLKGQVPPWCIEVIKTGQRSASGRLYPSRSHALFAVVCQLKRSGIDDQTIFNIIRDPKFAISASVNDTGSNADAYASRQIERASELAEVDEPELEELNERHAVIGDIGGKCRVATFTFDHDTKRWVMSFQTFQDIINRYSNRKIQVGVNEDGTPKFKPLAKWWLSHPLRRQFETIAFDPSGNCPDNVLNLWNGFAVTPTEGNWALMERHIREVLADGNEEHAEYILNYVAWTFQNPDKLAEVALALVGGKGTGKGTFGNAICAVFGQHALHIVSSNLLVGQFTGHLRDVVVLFADEAYWPGHKSAEGTIKGLITEAELAIEAKGQDAVMVVNRLHIIMATNESWVVPATPDERRFAVFELSPSRMQDSEYFAALNKQLYEQGGLEAMLYDLLNRDLDGWHPRNNVPQNAALRRQQIENLSSLERCWLEILMSGELPDVCRINPDGTAILGTRNFAQYARDQGGRQKITDNTVNDLLGKPQARGKKGMEYEKSGNERPRGYLIPCLRAAREAWDRARFPVDWDDTESWLGAVDHNHF